MFTLIALGTGASYLYSVAATLSSLRVLYRHKVFEPFELQADLLPGSVTHLGNLLDPFHAGFRRFGKWREREDFAQAGSR
jgi:hypothetical protein